MACFCRDPCAAAAREVRQLVLSGEADGRRLGELLDVLLGAQVPFKERLIGGGPWVVVRPLPAPPVQESFWGLRLNPRSNMRCALGRGASLPAPPVQSSRLGF